MEKIKELQVKNELLRREVMKYKAKEALNRKMFSFTLCDRKNGTRFIKIIYYDNEAGGWVEVARINLSKNEWVQDNFTMKDIFDELNR